MADLQIVAQGLIEDFGGLYHWVVMHDASKLSDGRVRCNGIDTICGIQIAEGWCATELVDTGAPDEPTCMSCLVGIGGGDHSVSLVEPERVLV